MGFGYALLPILYLNFKYSNTQKLNYSKIQMLKCSNAPLLICSNVQFSRIDDYYFPKEGKTTPHPPHYEWRSRSETMAGTASNFSSLPKLGCLMRNGTVTVLDVGYSCASRTLDEGVIL